MTKKTAVIALAVAVAGSVGIATAAIGSFEASLSDSARFASPSGDTVPTAVTYDESLVPEGARISVKQRVKNGRMAIRLQVAGVEPGYTFGAHVHTAPCGVDPAEAGGHYQNEPGEDPELATPENEVWLDVTTDADGAGSSVARQDWVFREGEAGSVVLHELPTSTGEDGHVPGHAGDRAACFTVPFYGEGA